MRKTGGTETGRVRRPAARAAAARMPRTWLATGGMLAVWAGVAEACAVCGHATTPGDPLGNGFYWGMLFLLATPFTVIGTIGGWLAYLYWRARPRRPQPARPAFGGSLQGVAWAGKEGER